MKACLNKYMDYISFPCFLQHFSTHKLMAGTFHTDANDTSDEPRLIELNDVLTSQTLIYVRQLLDKFSPFFAQ